MRLQKLLAPGKIGSMKLKNRFVVPPMGTNLATYNGEVTEEMIAYYRRRAKGGFGLIIIEVTAIDRKGKAIMNEVGLWDDDQIPMFKKLMDAVDILDGTKTPGNRILMIGGAAQPGPANKATEGALEAVLSL